MVISKKMGVGALVSVPGKCLTKEWGVRKLGPLWETSTTHGKVIAILPPLPPSHKGKKGKSKCPRGKIEILPAAHEPPGTPIEHILVDLGKVKLVQPGDPAHFLSAHEVEGAGEAGEAGEAGAGGGATAMDTGEEGEGEGEGEGEEELDPEEREFLEEKALEELRAEMEEREKPPEGVSVKWNDWDEVPFDARERDGYHDKKSYSLLHPQFEGNPSPLDVFKHFFPPALIENSVRATNQTGHRKCGASWKDIDEGLFMTFIAYWLAMGYHEIRSDYWSTEEEHPMFVNHKFGRYGISRNRFDQIISCLSFIPNTAAPPTDLEQVRTMQVAFNEHMEKAYAPSWLVCVDESMVPWYRPSKCPVWIHIPDKPTQRGMEFHTASDHSPNVIFRVELVRDPLATKYQDSCSDKVSSLTLRMVDHLRGTGRVVILDSYFATLETAIQLLRHGLYSTMVLKKRAHWPALTQGEELQEKTAAGAVGSVVARTGVVTDKRKGTKKVSVIEVGQKDVHRSLLVMSTWGTTELVDGVGVKPVVRKVYNPLNDEYIMHEFFRPAVIHVLKIACHSTDDLNRVRGGSNALEYVWRTKSWVHRSFTFFIALSEANSLNVYNDIHHKKLSLQEFRQALVKEIIPVPSEEVAAMAAPAPGPAPLIRHFWCSMPKNTHFTGGRFVTDPAFSDYPKRQCVVCGKRTRHFCICNPDLFLCEEHKEHTEDA